MILVVGEALVDLVIGLDGSVSAALGGAPYNAARAAARLGADVAFAGSLSRDRFGTMLVEQLGKDGVRTPEATRTDLPTTLATAELNAAGSATYRFYFDGTAAPELSLAALSEIPSADIVFTGGLALVVRPLADVVAEMITDLSSSTLLLVDVNARPAVIDDRSVYLATLRRVLARADVVKVSDEDLDVLAPDFDVESMLDAGVHAVIVTTGSSPTQIVHRAGTRSVPVPPLRAPIVDTIGAGDTFVGAFMATWSAQSGDIGDIGAQAGGRAALDGDEGLERVVRAVEAGHAAAGIVVTRQGADPPTRTDLDGHNGHTR
jgi:fructokinase